MNTIFEYSRAQAIDDGVLVDVSAMAREAGFVLPVDVTSAVHAECVAVPLACPWQDEQGRAWDLFMQLRMAIKKSGQHHRIPFRVLVQNDEREPEPIDLQAVCGPGDTAEPVITIMLPNED